MFYVEFIYLYNTF